jgi:hypothetical protein
MYSLKMSMAKAKTYQNKNTKDYIKLEIENEKKLNEIIKNCKTKNPLLHKHYVKNIKNLLLEKNDIVIVKTNHEILNKNKIRIYDHVHPGFSAVVYDITEEY